MGRRVFSQVGGELASSGNLNLRGPVAAPALNLANSFWNAPQSPYATFDDEFSSGSPDLAIRGWIVRDVSTGATIIRSGDVDPYGISATGYLSTLTPSGLLIRPPSTSSGMAIYKVLDGGLVDAVSMLVECYPSRGTSVAPNGYDLMIANQGLRFDNALKSVGSNWRTSARANFTCNTGLVFNGFVQLTEAAESAWGCTVIDYTSVANASLGEVAGQTYVSCIDPVAERISAHQVFTHPSPFMPAAMGVMVQNNSTTDRLQYFTLRRMRRLAHRSWPGLY